MTGPRLEELRNRPRAEVARDGIRALRTLGSRADLCLTETVLVYGIASSVSRDVDDFHATAAEAEATLEEIVADEPELEGALWVEAVELDLSAN